MIELLVALIVMGIALTAFVLAFAVGIVAMKGAANTTTASFLADAQMESYRAMLSRDVGLDVSTGTVTALDTTYKNDAACANATTSTTCAASGVATTETGPTGTVPHTCATINGWYPNTTPYVPSRLVSSTTTPASPDGGAYRIDTYIVKLAADTSGVTNQRATKLVTVVVRSAALRVLARETSVFDCSTGVDPNSSDC